MEKCTYCVQAHQQRAHRIGKIERPIRDGAIVTALRTGCPTEPSFSATQ